MIILSDLVEILPPDLIACRIRQLLNKKYPSGDTRYPHVSVVWIVSELHVLKTEMGQELLPSIVLVNAYSPSYQEANDYVNWLQRKWASFNNIPLVDGNFDMIWNKSSIRNELHSPETIPRSEMWRKQYTITPYLRRLSEEQLLMHGQQIWYEILPAFLKGTHEKPSQEKVFELMELQSHLTEETNYRGIDFREFSPKLHEAFDRLQHEGKLKLQGQHVGEGDQANNLLGAD